MNKNPALRAKDYALAYGIEEDNKSKMKGIAKAAWKNRNLNTCKNCLDKKLTDQEKNSDFFAEKTIIRLLNIATKMKVSSGMDRPKVVNLLFFQKNYHRANERKGSFKKWKLFQTYKKLLLTKLMFILSITSGAYVF